MDTTQMRNFECPICNEYLQKPIYQCATGHSFCLKCISKLTACSFCMKEFTSTRNYTLEAIIDNIVLKCKNEKCTKIIPLNNYAKHMIECEFSAQKCKVPNCKWMNGLALLNEHIKSEHKSLLVKSNNILLTHQFAFAVVQYKTHLFYLQRYTNEVITWTIESVVPTKDKFMLNIKIITANGAIHILKQQCSNPETNEQVLKNQSVLCMMKSKTKGCKFQVIIENEK